MFDFRNYIKQGFIDAIGKMSDYQIILNSAGYAEKGVLLEEDLAEIKALIDEKNSKEIENSSSVEEIPEGNAENIENSAEENTENTAEPTIDELLAEKTEEPLILE